jgi:hypothetical protein
MLNIKTNRSELGLIAIVYLVGFQGIIIIDGVFKKMMKNISILAVLLQSKLIIALKLSLAFSPPTMTSNN